MTTYYIDFTGGLDANDGTTTSSAWKTITKVNGASFASGDSVLFKRGETWTGICLIVPTSNLTLADYDSGAKPIIDGSDTVTCVDGNGKSYLQFENLDITQGKDFGFAFSSEHHVYLINCDAHDCGNDNVILSGCYSCEISGGDFYAGYSRVADGRQVTGIELMDGCHDIEISDVNCHHQLSGGVGIGVHSHSGTTMPYNITISGGTYYNNSGAGIQILKQDNTADTARNIVIRGCNSYSNERGVYTYKSGTQLLNGVSMYDIQTSLNTSESLFVNLCSNIYMERCVWAGPRGPIISSTQGITAYNCIFYNNNNSIPGFRLSGATQNNVVVKNSIIVNDISGNAVISHSGGTTGYSINNNLYKSAGLPTNTHWAWNGTLYTWANWKIISGMDADSPTPADPQFTNKAGYVFTLQSISPAIDVGTFLGLPYSGVAPDLGYWESASTLTARQPVFIAQDTLSVETVKRKTIEVD